MSATAEREPRDIPITFSGPMVRALLAGHKTMTRRLAYRPANIGEEIGPGSRITWMETRTAKVVTRESPSPWAKVKPGDRLWVRENFRVQQVNRVQEMVRGESITKLSVCIDYAADGHRSHLQIAEGDAPKIVRQRGAGASGEQTKLLPCIHLPMVASRITLPITTKHVEHLQKMTQQEALAEGMGADVMRDWPPEMMRRYSYTPRDTFAGLWNLLHGRDAWDQNPPVVAIGFDVQKANIASLPR